jgi:hypothetical protein
MTIYQMTKLVWRKDCNEVVPRLLYIKQLFVGNAKIYHQERVQEWVGRQIQNVGLVAIGAVICRSHNSFSSLVISTFVL